MSRSPAAPVSVALLITLLLLWGFVRPPASAGVLRVGPARARHDPVTTRLSDEGDLGEPVYRRYCSGCHGLQGDGNGPAASLLYPRPRDFTKGVYKFTTAPAYSLPLDEDLMRTITYGLEGTAMPGWRLLPEAERASLVQYLKRFTDWDPDAVRPAVPFHENPFDLSDPQDLEKAIENGRERYHQAECWQCHPAYMTAEELRSLTGRDGRPQMDRPEGKPDFWGEVILPPDFRRDTLKSVRTLRDLYRVITAGVGGTAMPSWKALGGDELWALAVYVDSLRDRGIIRSRLRSQGGDRR